MFQEIKQTPRIILKIILKLNNINIINMYTTIIHPIRKAFSLSMNEYAVLDSIMKLSNNTEFSGWCIISRDKLGKELDLSKPTIIKIYDTLEIKGLISKNTLGHARPVQMFIDLFSPGNNINLAISSEKDLLMSVKKFTSGKETLPINDGKKIDHRLRNFTEIGKETLPYNNKDNNKYIYSKYYDKEIEIAKEKDPESTYPNFVKWLFITNPNKKPLSKVLSLSDQISYESFKDLMSEYEGEEIRQTILSIENYTKKSYKSFNLTLRSWLRNQK